MTVRKATNKFAGTLNPVEARRGIMDITGRGVHPLNVSLFHKQGR